MELRWQANPRWLWYAIDQRSGKVPAYVFGGRKDEFLQLKLKQLLEPCGISSFYADGWGRVRASSRSEKSINMQKIASK